MNHYHHSRPIGFFERYCISRTTQGFYSNVGIVARLNHPITPQILSRALRQMIKSNPWLVVNYFTSSKTAYDVDFEDYSACAVNEIKFWNVVSFEMVPTFDENLLEKIDKFRLVMDCSTLPLWHIFIYTTMDTNEQYICGCFDHAIFDGLSAVEFHKDLTKALAKVSDDVNNNVASTLFDYETDRVFLPRELPLPTELKTDLYTPSWFARLKFLAWKSIGSILLAPLIYLKNLYTSSLPPFTTGLTMNKDISTKFKIIRFEPQEMRQLTEFCKKQGLTLTPLLHTIGLQCLEQSFHSHFPSASKPHFTKSMIAINGRRYYPNFMKKFNYGPTVSAQEIIMPALAATTSHEVLKKVHYVHDQIKDNLVTRQSFKDFWFLSYENIVKFLYGKLEQMDSKTHLATSNLGKVELAEFENQWNIEEMWFVSNSSITYHFLFNMITSPSGILNLVIPYSLEFDNLYDAINGKSRKTIDLFAELLKSRLLSLSL